MSVVPHKSSAAPKACRECGVSLSAPTGKQGRPTEFCSSDHRTRFHNLLAKRGAKIIPLYMAHKWNRKEAFPMKVQRAMDRLASRWRDEDIKAGRDSSGDWRIILAADPSLTTDFIHADRNPWSEGR